MLDGFWSSELLQHFDGLKLLDLFRFTCEEDGRRGDKNIKGSNMNDTVSQAAFRVAAESCLV